MACSSRPALVTFLIAAGLSPARVAAQEPPGAPVAATAHFTFHSDFPTNLNDALVEAGNARRSGRPELFQSGEEQPCFDALPEAERAAWNSAVGYYAEAVSPAEVFARSRTLVRLGLLFGGSEWAQGEERRFVELAALFRAAASQAYERCRWPAQDAANRRWIDDAVRLVRAHEAAVAMRLQELYEARWTDLPIRVDVVRTVSMYGADSLFVGPPPNHVLVGSGVAANQGSAALEVLYHEASHFLSGDGSALQRAFAGAEDDRPWHAALFYITGETVRRVLADAGRPDYVPYMRARNVFTPEMREAVSSAFGPYVDGQRTLDEAAAELLRAAAR